MRSNHVYFWDQAFLEAQKAYAINEVPVGAVIVREGIIVGRGHNQRISKKNALLHAEMVAIKNACDQLDVWRLDDCDMYVTLEPCAMCTGASIESRLRKVYFAALDEKTGCVLSQYTLLDDKMLSHRVDYEYIPQARCQKIMGDFFETLRDGAKGDRERCPLP